ncbi:AAA family ATPase [Pandoraea pnomenusa]|nr:AAA family ATPase [Pandoraea pnomenusa]
MRRNLLGARTIDETFMQALRPAGRVIVLNGPSSSGKSTLAKYLRENLEQQHLHVELDAFRRMEPAQYWDVEKPTIQVRVAALCRAINATVATFSRHGEAVIVDHVLSADAWRYLLEDLSELPVLIVGVFCELDVLKGREATRGDRKIGLAASQFRSIHANRHYDYVVDTSSTNADECGRRVLEWLDTQPAPAAFATMRQRLLR